jgi:hypothetical protein
MGRAGCVRGNVGELLQVLVVLGKLADELFFFFFLFLSSVMSRWIEIQCEWSPS